MRRLFFAALLLLAGRVLAVEPDEMLDDPVLEARARAISQELRCLVCRNETIDDSNAGLAKDLRVLVRERLVAGDSDEQVVAFVVARYGDFVLLKPPLTGETFFLWFGPLAVLLVGLLGILAYYRRARASLPEAPPDLTPEERRQVADIVDSGEGS
jgi:cytochrome c-type biogenesis protein CcmH